MIGIERLVFEQLLGLELITQEEYLRAVNLLLRKEEQNKYDDKRPVQGLEPQSCDL